jgi:hypothetical protein
VLLQIGLFGAWNYRLLHQPAREPECGVVRENALRAASFPPLVVCIALDPEDDTKLPYSTYARGRGDAEDQGDLLN